jgi:hypothetical protein
MIEECSGRGIKARKSDKRNQKTQKTSDHRFKGINDYADFKKPYLGLRETKSGLGWIDGKMERIRTIWDCNI